jgi:hypothetical protein
VALVDTGVNFAHPHLRLTGEAWSVVWADGALEVRPGEAADHFGHGTCCAALLHGLAPEAALVAIRVTAERPTTDADRIAAGIALAVQAGAKVVAVPLGARTLLRGGLDAAVDAAVRAGALVVAADPEVGEPVLPAACPGAWAARLRDGVDVAGDPPVLYADGRARGAPGHARNFWGPSLACARIAAAVARALEVYGPEGLSPAEALSKALVVR